MDARLKTTEDPRPLIREGCIVETVLEIIGGATVIEDGIEYHISGTRAGVAGTYNRSELLPERKAALERWATHVQGLVVPWPDSVVSLPSRKGKRK
jgi:hypothetical protein